ncbi:hypothetical protein MMSR116_04270 [Methylobacterium mesophilicum SR1.6/6]|uniref:Uncharacterized protein n=2 Tax=Methylobacterium mesophilicum TaxID=39956 RepID=A0A6B9FJ47_9HYPH|nr:hypothetical protein MMSR116_04270 [Methylobacterium mesophilicum SR1.6/6]
MHFARIDGSYVIASEVLDSPMRGSDFRALINQVAQRYPGLLPIPQGADGTKLSVHPAALLAALVAAAALSLSPQDAFAADQERSGDEPGPADQAGQMLPTGAPGAGDAGDADERDSHRKQFGVIVFSAMVFAADAFAADHVEPGTAPGLTDGSQGGNGVAAWEQGGSPVPAGEAARSADAGVPLTAGTRDHAPNGTSGFTTAEANAAATAHPQPGDADLRALGLGNPTLGHGPSQSSLEPAHQASAQAAEASTTRAAGSSPSPETRADAGADASGSAEGTGQADSSPATTGEAASQTPSATLANGHSASEMPSAQIDGVTTLPQLALSRLASPQREDGSRGQDHAAKDGLILDEGASHAASTVADADHSGTSELDQNRPGAVGHGAADGANAGHQSGASPAEASGAALNAAPAGGPPGKSAEAPGQLKEAGSDAHAAVGHGAADGANAGHQSGASPAEASDAALNATPAGGSPGKSAEAPGQLKEAGSDAHAAVGHGAADGANGALPSPPQAGTNGADPGHAQPGTEAQGAPHAKGAAAADLGPQVSSGRPTDPPGPGTPTTVSGNHPSSMTQTSQADGHNPANPPAAHVDVTGNIVFSSNGQHGPAAAPSHTPADAGAHGDVGLIGLSDHGTNAHHLDLHS